MVPKKVINSITFGCAENTQCPNFVPPPPPCEGRIKNRQESVGRNQWGRGVYEQKPQKCFWRLPEALRSIILWITSRLGKPHDPERLEVRSPSRITRTYAIPLLLLLEPSQMVPRHNIAEQAVADWMKAWQAGANAVVTTLSSDTVLPTGKDNRRVSVWSLETKSEKPERLNNQHAVQ